MKHSAFYILILISLLSCEKQNPTGISNELYSISQDEIDIHFTTKYRSEDLKNIQMSLDSFGIIIVYDSASFDEGGYLKKISASIYYSDNNKSSIANKSSIVSRELPDENGPGFSYRYTRKR